MNLTCGPCEERLKNTDDLAFLELRGLGQTAEDRNVLRPCPASRSEADLSEDDQRSQCPFRMMVRRWTPEPHEGEDFVVLPRPWNSNFT